MRSASRVGPLTNSTGKTLEVVVVMATAFHSGRRTASSAASTRGKARGSQPAITALMAISSTLARPCRGGSAPSAWSAGSGVAASRSTMRASVGATSGAPSPHPSASDRA
jgi:hypothetical protein